MGKFDESFYSPRMEYRKDNAPTTGAFIWVMVAGVILAIICKTDAVVEPHHQPAFDLQDSAFICVMGQCL